MARKGKIIATLGVSLLVVMTLVKLPSIDWGMIYSEMPNFPDRILTMAFLLAWYFGFQGNRWYH